MAIELDTQDISNLEELSLPPQLGNLSKLIGNQPEALVTGSEDFRKAALDATKFIYDAALLTEKNACKKINELLTSISPSYAPQTRSQTAESNRKRKRGSSSPSLPEPSVSLMKETPLAELFVEGMSDEQIWAELELRAQNVCEVLNHALDGPAHGGDSGENDDDEDKQERELKKMRQALIEEGFDPDELDGMGLEGDDGEDDEDEDEEDSESGDEEEDDEEEEADDEDVEGDDDLGEGVEGLRDSSDSDDDQDGLEAEEPSFPSDGEQTRTVTSELKRSGHTVLDDGFFDLAAFNAQIEAAESKNVSRGRLNDDDDEEDDDIESVDFFAPVDDTAAFDKDDLEDGGELFYKDFFEPPSRVKASGAKRPPKAIVETPFSTGKVRFHDEVRVRKIKAKGKNLPVSTMFYEEDDEDEDDDDTYEDEGAGFDDDEEESESGSHVHDEEAENASVEDGEGGEPSLVTMERLKDDLFADNEEEYQEGLSTHERRMAALREEIAALEAENVGEKDWTLMGEATSRSRPQNSLLEEDLHFERVMKSVPVITEDVVHSLEERIKARILENRFDDVVRKRPVGDKPFLPSRFFELLDTKSKQSLAEIYEDEYTAAQTGGVAGEDRDGKLKKEHQEIEKLWENICSKLDALCNAHFTPKAPQATIASVSNVAAATLESALPTAKATSTMLTPEEVYAPTLSHLRARSELTPAEKRALRNKQKSMNKKARDAIEKSVQKFGRPKGVGDVKRQKDAALKTLVKIGKGVTIVGKTSKQAEGKRGRGKT